MIGCGEKMTDDRRILYGMVLIAFAMAAGITRIEAFPELSIMIGFALGAFGGMWIVQGFYV